MQVNDPGTSVHSFDFEGRCPLRVAVIGASGIGKNHARWFHSHGCQVCAIAGSSPGSVARAQGALAQSFPYSGRGYDDVEEMLRCEKPEVVCVSSPPEIHYQHALVSLLAGAHVLCEKPLVYDPALDTTTLLAQAHQLVSEAGRQGVLLATQTQYAAAVPELLGLIGRDDAQTVREFTMMMETKNLKHAREYEALWIDLSPHPLSVLQKLAQDSALVPDTVECEMGRHTSIARFALRRANGSRVDASVQVSLNPAAEVPRRCFVIDGQTVEYTGRHNTQGIYKAYLSCPGGGEVVLADPVDTLIGQFVEACQGRGMPIVTGADGAQNLEWQLQIVTASHRV